MSGAVLARAVVVLGGDSSELDKVMTAAEHRMTTAGKKWEDIGKTLSTKVTLPLLALGGLSVKAFGDQEDALAKMQGVLAASGNAAGVTYSHLKQLGEQLQETTTFEDDVTESAMGVLLAFQNVRNEVGQGNDVFDRTIKVAQDLSELMGRDLQGAVFALGKTMENPEEGMVLLRRAGVILSDQIKDQIKDLQLHGKTLEAQKMVLDQVEGRVKNLAQTMAQTPMGKFRQSWNEVHDAMEPVGKVLADMIVLPVADKVKGWAKEFKGLDEEAQRTYVTLGLIVAIIPPILVVLGTAGRVMAFLSVGLSTLANAIGPLIITFEGLAGGAGAFAIGTTSILAPVALLIAAFGALALAGYQVAQNWTWLKLQTVSLWAFIKDSFFSGVDAVLGAIQTMLSGLGLWGKSMKQSGGALGAVGTALSFLATPLDMAASGIGDVRTSLQELADESMASSGAAITALEMKLDEVGVTATKTADAITKVNKKNPAPPVWLKATEEALKKFSEALREARSMEKLLGTSFDETSAQADAYEAVVQALVAAGTPLDTVIGKNGETLRQLAGRYLELKQQVDQAQDMQDSYNAAIDRAKSAVESALTPAQIYKQTIMDLDTALAAGKITWDEYNAAVEHAKVVMDDANNKTSKLQRSMEDLARKGVSDFVDAVFDAKTSWGEFFKQMIMDLVKLIIKMEIMNALFPEAKGGKFLGGILGFADGGFLPGGQVGMVGERGPELIMSGRSGVTVTPLPAMGAAGGGESGGGGDITVQVNVNAIDRRGVVEFFEENEGLVAGAMLRASQRSSLLRRKVG